MTSLKYKKVFYEMKKSTVCLFILIGVVLSACVYFSAPHDKKTDTQPVSAQDEMSEMDRVFYETVGDRVYRNAPDTAAFGAFLAASYAKEQSDFKKAADLYAKALETDPTAPDLLANTFLMYVMAGDVRAAVPYAALEIDQNPDNLLPRLVLLSDLFVQKQYADARKMLNEQREQMQSELFEVSLFPLMTAWTYVGENNQKKALSALAPLMTVKGLEGYYYLHEGLILDYFGENSKATKSYEQLMRVDDNQSMRSMLVVYDFYRRTNQLNTHPEFVKMYDAMQNTSFVSKDLMTNPRERYRALNANDGLSMVYFDVGSLVSQVESYETALYLVQLALYLNPESSINKLFLGEVLEEMNLQSMANTVYRSVPKGKDLYRSMQLRLIMSLQKMGRLDDGQKEITRLIKEFPDIPIYYMTQGDLYRDMQAYDKALVSYQKALDLFKLKEDPQAAVLYFNLAVCYEALGQLDKADELLQKAVSLDGQNAVYLNYLGYTWVERNKNLPQALTMIETAVKQVPNDGNLLDSLGWAHYMMGNYAEALPVMERAVEYEAGNAIINEHLGDVYWRLGRFRDARFQWAHARSLKQHNSEQLKARLDEKIEKGLPSISRKN